LDGAINSEIVLAKGVAHRYTALIQREKNEPSQKTINTLMASAQLIEQVGCHAELVKTKMELAREYLSINQPDEARETMRSLIPIFDVYGEHLIPDDLRFLCKNLEGKNGPKHDRTAGKTAEDFARPWIEKN